MKFRRRMLAFPARKPGNLFYAFATIFLVGLSLLAWKVSAQTGETIRFQTGEEDSEGGNIFVRQRIEGVIHDPADTDVYYFYGLAGESIKIDLSATFGALNPAVTLLRGVYPLPPLGLAAHPAATALNTDRAPGPLSASDRLSNGSVRQFPEKFVFEPGNVFAAIGNGKVKRFSSSGTQLQTLDGGGSGFTTGMGFDKQGNLYVTMFGLGRVEKYDVNGDFVEVFASGLSAPESLAFDLQGNVYVSNANTTQLNKYDASGQLLATYTLAIEDRGVDWIDLAADQKTIYYTSEGKNIKRFDVESSMQLPDFNAAPLPGTRAYALRILSDGGVLVADSQTIIRLNASGAIVQQYDAPGEDEWFAINLDPDGETFWSGSLRISVASAKIYRFNLASGQIITSFESATQADPIVSLAGLAVFGELTAAQGLNISKSAPAQVAPNGRITYTITFSNPSTLPATNVVIEDEVPAGTTFVSATDGGTLSNGVVRWNLGTVPPQSGNREVSFTVQVHQRSGQIVNSHYSIRGDDIPSAAGAPVVTEIGQPVLIHDDNSGPANNALIKLFQVPETGIYTVLVSASRAATTGAYELIISPVDQDSNRAAVELDASPDIARVFSTRERNRQIFSAGGTPSPPATFLEFSPDGETAAVHLDAESDILHFYALREPSNRLILSVGGTPTPPATFLAFTPDGGAVAVARGEPPTTVELWSMREPHTLIFSVGGGAGPDAGFLGFSVDGDAAAIVSGPAGAPDTVRVFSTREPQTVIFSAGGGAGPAATFLQFGPDGETAAVALGPPPELQIVRVYSTRAMNETIFSVGGPPGPDAVFQSYSPEGDSVAVARESVPPSLEVFSTRKSNTRLFSVGGPPGPAATFAGYSPDADAVAVAIGTTPPSLRVFSTVDDNLPEGEQVTNRDIFSIGGPPGPAALFAGFTPDGESAAVILETSPNTARLMSARRPNHTIFSEGGPPGPPASFAGFAPDGATVAVSLDTNPDTLRVKSAREDNSTVFSVGGPPGPEAVLIGYGPDAKSAAVLVGGTTVQIFGTVMPNQMILSAGGSSGPDAGFLGYSLDGDLAAVTSGGVPGNVTVFSTRPSNGTIFSSGGPPGAPAFFSGFSLDGDSAALTVDANPDIVRVFNTRQANDPVFSVGGIPSPSAIFSGFSISGDAAAVTLDADPDIVRLFSTREDNKTIFSQGGTPSPSASLLGFSLDSDVVAVHLDANPDIVRVFSTREDNDMLFSQGGTPSPSAVFAGFSFDRTPSEPPPGAPQVTMNFPFLRSTQKLFTGIAFLNMGMEEAGLRLFAYDVPGELFKGTAVTNPAIARLAGSQQLPRVAPEFFNFASEVNEGFVQVESDQKPVIGFEILGSNEISLLDGVDAPIAHSSQVILTNIQLDNRYTTEVHLINIGDFRNEVSLELRQAPTGSAFPARRVTLDPKEKLVENIEDLFSGLGKPFVGYLLIRASRPVGAAELMVSKESIAALNAQIPEPFVDFPIRLYSAQLGTGPTLFTLFNIVNPTDQAAELMIRAVGETGTDLAPPVARMLGPGEQFQQEAGELFGFNPNITVVGSIVVESSITGLVGDVTFGDATANNRFRASLALDSRPALFAAYGHIANDAGFFTGVAGFNPNGLPTEVTVEVFRANGVFVDSGVVQVPARGRFSKLVPEIVREAAGQVQGFFTVKSTLPITSFALFGPFNLNSLAAIPGQRPVTFSPVPVLMSMEPDSATEGGEAFELVVHGRLFVRGAKVLWNGEERETTFNSDTELVAQIEASDLTVAGIAQFGDLKPAAVGTAEVTVANPEPGGGVSEPLEFTILSKPAIAVNPANLAFGEVPVGQSKDLDLTVRNTGETELNVESVTSNNARFTVVSPAVPFMVPGGGQQIVKVRFTPQTTESQNGMLRITSDDPERPNLDVPMTGKGTSTSTGDLVSDHTFNNTLSNSVAGAPPLVNLGDNTFIAANVDGQARTVLHFARNNGLSLAINGLIPNNQFTIVALFSFEEVDGWRRIFGFKNGTDDAGLYSRDGLLNFFPVVSGVGTAIAVNQFAQVVLTRDGGRTVKAFLNGVKQLEFLDDVDRALIDENNTLRFFQDNTSGGVGNEASAGNVARIRLYDRVLSEAEVMALDRLPGGGPPATPNIEASPPNLNFGNVLVGGSQTLDLVLRNTGTAGLNVASFNSSDAQFQVTSPATPFEIAAGGQRTVSVRFSPASTGSKMATLTVNSNDPDQPNLPVPLSGIGVTEMAGPELKADYQFQNSLNSTVAGAPALMNLGANFFEQKVVDTVNRTVLSFAEDDGLDLSFENGGASSLGSESRLVVPSGIVPNDTFTIAVLFAFADVDGYRRIVDFKGGAADEGVFVVDSFLGFFDEAEGPLPLIQPNRWVQVVVTRNAEGTVTGYVNGIPQFEFQDEFQLAVIEGILRFFRDNLGDASAGSVARIQLWNGPLNEEAVNTLERLPGGSPGTAPTIENVEAELTDVTGNEISHLVEFNDPDGDIIVLVFEWLIDGELAFAGAVSSPENIDLEGVTSGSENITFIGFGADGLLVDEVRVRAIDATGRRSNIFTAPVE